MSLSPSSSRGSGGLYPAVTGRAAYVPSSGVAASDTAALQAAHDALSANGGTLALMTGGSGAIVGAGTGSGAAVPPAFVRFVAV